MNEKNIRLVTAESVRAGHPDKFCDQIADAILDAHLAHDPAARVAVEVFSTEGKMIIGGEITSNADVDCGEIVAKPSTASATACAISQMIPRAN